MTKPSVVARESQHTKLPWELRAEILHDGEYHVAGRGPSIVANGIKVICRFPSGSGQSRHVAHANAEFIVRACNSHQALIDAFKAIFSTNALYAWVSEKGIGDAEWKRRSAIIQQAEQALRLAQGEK